MTLLRCSARLVTHTLELLGTKQRSVYLISCSHSQLLHTGNLPLVPKDKCPTPASRVAQQQTVRVSTSSASEFSRRQKHETAASCRDLQRVQLTHLGQGQSSQTAFLALFQALKTFKLQLIPPATLTMRAMVLMYQHWFKDQQCQRQKRMSFCKRFSRQAKSISGKSTLPLSSDFINHEQFKALRHLQHDRHHSLSNHVVVCHKSAHFSRLTALVCIISVLLLLVLAPLSEIIQPSTVMPEYNHGHIGIPAQLLSKNGMPPKTLQHDAVTPVVQAHTFTAAVWE